MKAKKSLSSLDVAVLALELSREVRDGWIDNIYSSNNGLLLSLRLRSGLLKYIIIEPGIRVNITKGILDKGLAGRVRIFRRFVRNARVSTIAQYRFERILLFDLLKSSSKLTLIVELLPRGVVALINGGGRILVSDKDIQVKDRVIRPGLKYSYPPVFPDPRSLSLELWVSRLKSYGSLGRGLVKGLGLPPELVNEAISEDLRNSEVDKLTTEKIIEVRRTLLKFIEDILRDPHPVTVFCGGNPYAFYPFIPSNLPEDCIIRKHSSMNEAIDYYFTHLRLLKSSGMSNEGLRIRKTLDKASSDLEILKRRLNELIELQQVFNERYSSIENLWLCVRSKVKSSSWERVKECGVLSYDPSKGYFTIELEGRKLMLKVNESVKEQYIQLLKDLGVLRRKVKRAEESLKNLQERLRNASAAEGRKVIKLIKRVEWFHHYHWLITSGGYLAIGGRDAQQNEKVVSKYLGPKDIFVHASVHGGSVFVIKTEGGIPEDRDLREVATMAVSYSRGWKEGIGALDAFWVWGKQVSRSPPPGEYLPKGSFMIYGKRNIIRDVELRVSVGIRVLGGRFYEVATGPEWSFLEKDGIIAFMTIVPGVHKPSEISREFIRKLEKTDYEFLGLQESDISTKIPGPSNMVKVWFK